MGKFCQCQTEVSAHHTSVFSFLDDNLSKCQWIFTKLGMCIDIVAIWFGLQVGKLHQLLTELSAGLGGSVGCAVRLETRRSRVQPPPRSATFFRGD